MRTGVLSTFTILGGTNQSCGVKSIILYIKFISSYKISKKKLLWGGHVPPDPASRAWLRAYLSKNKNNY